MLFRSNNPGDWNTVYWPLLHADWNGWTPTDLIFPFFLFIVGTAIGLGTRRATTATILRRGAIIWGLGLFLAAYPFFRLETVRITGVLARIAWCYVPAALMARAAASRPQRRVIITAICAVLLVAYWIALRAGTDLSAEGNLGAWIDRKIGRAHV